MYMDGDFSLVSPLSTYRVMPRLRVPSSDASNSSALKLEVYARRNIVSDDLIGEMEETIEILLGQKGERARQDILFLITDPSPIDVVRTLSKRDSNGAAQDLRCVVKFTIVSINDSVGAQERQMDEAVDQAKQAIEQMASGSLAIVPLDSAVTTANSVPAQLESTWVPLLSKIDQFTKIVDGIAEV